MRATCLFVVLAVAKTMAVPAAALGSSGWAPVAYYQSDVLVAMVAALLDRLLERPRLGWIAYGAAVLVVALDVPVARVLGAPLTLTMLRAARGPLSGSIAYYLSPDAVLRSTGIALLGLALPVWLSRVSWKWSRGARNVAVLAGLGIIACGPVAAARTAAGSQRLNAFTALLPLGLPVVAAAPVGVDWRASPLGDARSTDDLASSRGSARGMNVLMVVLESTGAQYLAPYGASDDPMPHLTALARRALLFEHAYAAYPESIKGLLTTLCSTDPVFNAPVETLASRPCESIAARLQATGYRTALFHSGRFDYLGMDAVVRHRGFDLLEDAGAIGGQHQSSFGVDESSTVERILRWIDLGPPDRPFFVSYLPIAGHHPYGAPGPPRFGADTDLGRYKNALLYADAALGDLLTGLEARRLKDRTLVVVFGDHGEAFGQHAGNIGHTLFVYDENLWVPYMIAVPRTRPARVSRVVSLVDTAPTLLDLLDLPASPGQDGRSLLRPDSRMALFLTDYALGWLGLRDGCWKYQLETGSRRAMLFDTCQDPKELHNLVGREPRRAEAYRLRVEQWALANVVRH